MGHIASRSDHVVTYAVLLAMALVAGCTGGAGNTERATRAGVSRPSSAEASSAVSVSGGVSGQRVVVTDIGVGARPGKGAEFVSHVYSLAPSGPLAKPVNVTIELTHAVQAATPVVIATREAPRVRWTYLRATLTRDRRHVRFTTHHLSFFGAVALDAATFLQAFKQDFIDGIDSGITQTVVPPTCQGEAAARLDGFTITSSDKNTVYWCFGIENGLRVLKVTNRERFPLELAHPNMALISNPLDSGSLASLSRFTSGNYSILAPGATAVYNADLAPGDSEGISTEMDGLGQSLYALQVGVQSLVSVMTRFGYAKGPKAAEIADKILTVPACAASLGKGSGDIITACFGPKVITDAFGVWGLLVAPVMAVSPFVGFILSEKDALVSQFTNSDRYQIDIHRAATADLNVIEPGRLGPLSVGMDAHQAQRLGLTQRSSSGICGAKWEGTDKLASRNVSLEYRFGQSSDKLDAIVVSGPMNSVNPTTYRPSPVHTPEGIKIGASTTTLLRIYGNRITRGTFEGEGTYDAYVLFGPDGALQFVVYPDSTGQESVVAMAATAGRTMDSVPSAFNGC